MRFKMHVHELMAKQNEFDREHHSRVSWSAPITQESLDVLTNLVVCIAGEVGELANISKKLIRGDYTLDTAKPMIEEEVADIFIYVMKICSQSGIDLETAFHRKLELNRRRFSRQTCNEAYMNSQNPLEKYANALTKWQVKSDDDLAASVRAVGSAIGSNPVVLESLRRHVHADGLAVPATASELVEATVLSFLLAEIAENPDRCARESLVNRIERVSTALGLRFQLVLKLAGQRSELLHAVCQHA